MALRRAKSLRKMSREEIAWLAGLLEGEGSFTVRQRPGGDAVLLRVTVQMTDKDVVARVREIVGTGGFSGPRSNGPRGRKPVWVYALCARADVVALITLLRPFMGERRQAQIDRQLQADADHPPIVREVPDHGTVLRHDADGCRCERCKAAKRALNLRRYDAEKADGRCVVCQAHPATPGFGTCERCRVVARRRYVVRRERKLAQAREKRRALAGECVDCEAPLAFPGATRCRSCAARHWQAEKATA